MRRRYPAAILGVWLALWLQATGGSLWPVHKSSAWLPPSGGRLSPAVNFRLKAEATREETAEATSGGGQIRPEPNRGGAVDLASIDIKVELDRMKPAAGYDISLFHAFTWGPGGDLCFQEGTFLHSQVETPYGTVRLEEAGVFRYEQRTETLSVFGSYGFANPWGHVVDRWGQHFISDASNGNTLDSTMTTLQKAWKPALTAGRPFAADNPDATRLINTGETARLRFTVPTRSGSYPYVCTFPGHWRTMNGLMSVVRAGTTLPGR